MSLTWVGDMGHWFLSLPTVVGSCRRRESTSCHVMSCHVMSCHVMSCHVMSCHVMSCHVRILASQNVADSCLWQELLTRLIDKSLGHSRWQDSLTDARDNAIRSAFGFMGSSCFLFWIDWEQGIYIIGYTIGSWLRIRNSLAMIN